MEPCHDQTDPDGTQVANDKLAGRLELIEIRHTFDAVFSSALSTSDTGDRAARGRLALFRQFGNTRLDAGIAEQPILTCSIPLKTAAHEGMVKVSLNGAYANGQLVGKVGSGKRNAAAAGSGAVDIGKRRRNKSAKKRRPARSAQP